MNDCTPCVPCQKHRRRLYSASDASHAQPARAESCCVNAELPGSIELYWIVRNPNSNPNDRTMQRVYYTALRSIELH